MNEPLIPDLMKKVRKKIILNSKSIDEYIDNQLNSKLTKEEKRKIGKSLQINKKDLEKARNRHTYYKQLKNKNQGARQKKYTDAVKATKTGAWTDKELKELKKMLKHEYSNIELAKHFRRSVASIFNMKQKIRAGTK